MLGWGAVCERAAGVDTLVLMAEREERGHIRIQNPHDFPARHLPGYRPFPWTCELKDHEGDAGFPKPSRQQLPSSCHLIRLMAFKCLLWQ